MRYVHMYNVMMKYFLFILCILMDIFLYIPHKNRFEYSSIVRAKLWSKIIRQQNRIRSSVMKSDTSSILHTRHSCGEIAKELEPFKKYKNFSLSFHGTDSHGMASMGKQVHHLLKTILLSDTTVTWLLCEKKLVV